MRRLHTKAGAMAIKEETEISLANPACLCAAVTNSRLYNQPRRNGSRCYTTYDQPGLCGNAWPDPDV